MDDLGPGEPAAQPAFRGNDCGFAHRVVDRLALVLLTIKLDEEAQLRPRQVDECDEGAARALNTELANGVWQPGYWSRELDHQRLKDAAGRKRAWWAQLKHPANPRNARPCACEDGQLRLRLVDREQAHAQRRLERLFPDEVGHE